MHASHLQDNKTYLSLLIISNSPFLLRHEPETFHGEKIPQAPRYFLPPDWSALCIEGRREIYFPWALICVDNRWARLDFEPMALEQLKMISKTNSDAHQINLQNIMTVWECERRALLRCFVLGYILLGFDSITWRAWERSNFYGRMIKSLSAQKALANFPGKVGNRLFEERVCICEYPRVRWELGIYIRVHSCCVQFDGKFWEKNMRPDTILWALAFLTLKLS